MAYILLALLPIPPKFRGISGADDEERRQQNKTVLYTVLRKILEPLQDARPADLVCADSNRRRCYLVLAAWIADHAEHVLLHQLRSQACPRCEVAKEELGTPPEEAPPERDYDLYRAKYEKFVQTGKDRYADFLTDRDLKGVHNPFSGLPRVNPADLHKPDLLHNIYLGLLKHIMEWLESFLKAHHRMDDFDKAWGTLAPYPGFTVPKKSYREVTQWQGKEMRNLGRILLPVLAVALLRPKRSECDKFRRAILCIKAFVDFHLMAQYRSHTRETLGYLEQYLGEFHAHKDVFLEYRTSKTTRAKAKVMEKQLRETQGKAMDTAAKKGLTAAQRRKLNADHGKERENQTWQIQIEESHFNFVKIHLLSHYRAHVERFGNIPMFSTEAGESAHRDQIKDGYRRSNRNNATKQILDRYDQQLAMGIRLGTLKALGILNADTKSQDSKLSRRQLKGTDGMICTLGKLAEEMGMPEVPSKVAIYAQEQSKWTSGQNCLPTDVSDLRRFAAQQFKQLQIAVRQFAEPDQYDLHHVRCTGEKTFRNTGTRNDWVWLNVGDETKFGALRGRLPGLLLALLKLRNPNTGFVVRLAYIQVLQVLDGGNISGDHGLVKVALRSSAMTKGDRWIVGIGMVTGAAHLVPEDKGKWLVNSRIDLRTFNEVY
jgi:hypothetical protein